MESRRSLARCLAAWTVVGSAWVLVSRWLAPRLVRAAYEERSLGFVNRWLAGRDTHPLAEYLESWEALAARIDVALAALAVLTSLVLLFRLPERARRWKARVEAHERGGASLRFSAGETFLAAALIGLATGCLSGAYTAYVNHGRREAIPGFRILAVDVVWMAPLADVLFFLVLAGVLVGVGKAWSGLTERRRTLLPLLFAAGTGVLMLPGWFHAAAAVILAFALAYHGSRYLSVAWSPKRSHKIAVSLVVLVGAAAIFVRSSVALSERRALDSLPDRPPDAPNVILVILDAVRARNLGAYGYERPTSPRFDRLAETGVVFERAIATAPWSLPSHASMLTGRYNYELRTDFLRPLDDTYPTLAETLAGLGYVTIASLGNDFFGPAPYGLDRGFARYRVHPLTLGQVLRSSWLTGTLVPLVRGWLGNHQRLGRKRASAVNREILGWIDAAGDRPFFALVNYFDAHDPYLPPPPYDRRFIDPPYRYWLKSASEEYAEGELDELVAGYDNGIAYVDSQLGALVDALADRNALDRTLLIVTSDHGEAFLEHGEGAHGTSLHSEQLRVPLLLRFPGRVPAGARVDLPVSIRDIPATVMELVGADERPRRFPGKPLSRFWNPSGRPRPEEEAVLAELRRDRSVVQGFWHYIRSADGSEELYDLSRDPFERVDLADTEGGRAEVERMRRVLERLLAAGAADRAG